MNLTGHYFPGVDRDGAIEWRRHPADLARLVAASLALTAVLLLTAVEPDALTTCPMTSSTPPVTFPPRPAASLPACSRWERWPCRWSA